MATLVTVNYQGANGKDYQITVDSPLYTGQFFETSGAAILDRPKPKDLMTVRRGCQLDFTLLINETNETIFTELTKIAGDRQASVKLFEEGQTVFEGWLRPDGIQRPFDSRTFDLELQALDGLGYLSDIPYQKTPATETSPAVPYEGEEKELIILQRCLAATGINIELILYEFNIFYSEFPSEVPLDTNKPITETKVNQDRYKENDKEGSLFTCDKVVDSILKKYGGTIFYYKNQWHVLRIADFYDNELTSINFERYDVNGVLQNSDVFAKLTVLGSQVEGGTPYHAGRNQLVKYNGSLGAYKVYYEYGFVKSTVENPGIIWNSANDNDIDNWIVTVPGYPVYTWQGNPPVQTNPLRALLPARDTLELKPVVLVQDPASNLTQLREGDQAELSIGYIFQQAYGRMVARVSLQLVDDITGDTYFCNRDLDGWTLNGSNQAVIYHDVSTTNLALIDTGQVTINLPQAPVTGLVQIQFREVEADFVILPIGLFEGISLTSVNLSGDADENTKGESFKAKKVNDIMNLTEDTEDLFVGDTPSDLYIGAIKSTSGGNTFLWGRKALPSQTIPRPYKPVLWWLAQDRIALQFNNQIEFSGSVYGAYLPYRTMLRINGFSDCFMIAGYTWDTKLSIFEVTSIQLFKKRDAEVPDEILTTGPTPEGQVVIDVTVLD